MSRGPDAATLLERALRTSAERAGCPVTIMASDMTRWASATFVGARHSITLAASPSAALTQWIADLPEADLPLRNHLVAEASVTSTRHAAGTVTIEAEFLTIEDRAK